MQNVTFMEMPGIIREIVVINTPSTRCQQCLAPALKPWSLQASMEFLRSTGGRLASSSLCYGPDGKYLFLALNNIVLKVDGETGVECDRMITKCYSISTIVMHPHDPRNKLILGSEKGHIQCWNYNEKVMEWERRMEFCIKKIICHPGHDHFYVNAHSFSDSIMKVFCGNVKASPNEEVKFVCGYKETFDTWMTLSHDGSSLICASGIVLFIHALASDGSIINKEDRREVRYNEGLVNGCLLTDSQSNVYMCHESGDIASRSLHLSNTFTRHHWHAMPALSLALTPDEKYMLSGGREGVLVRWNLNSPRQEFISGLGAPIESIVCHPSGTVYALAMKSNNVIFIDAASFEPLPVQPINFVKGESRLSYLPADPRMPSNVLVNSIPGVLQSIDPITCKTNPSSDIDVSQQNNITWGGEGEQVSFCDVFAVATSPDSKWTATYDCLPCPKSGFLWLGTLRFWMTDELESGLRLKETIELPHEAPIQNIYFAPNLLPNGSPLCLTMGMDGMVKSWTLKNQKWIYGWTLIFKNKTCKAVAFSKDCSVLAVSVENTIHLFDCRNLEVKPILLHILPCGLPSSSPLKRVIFVSNYLVAIDDKTIYSWHLPTLSLRWSASFPLITHIIDHPSKPLMYVAVRDRDTKNAKASAVLCLNPESYTPLNIISRFDRFVSMSLMTKPSHPYILLLNENRDFFIVGLDGKRPFIGSHFANSLASSTNPSEVTVPSPQVEEESSPAIAAPIILPRISRDSLLMSSIPSHQLPSMEALFDHYIKFKLPLVN